MGSGFAHRWVAGASCAAALACLASCTVPAPPAPRVVAEHEQRPHHVIVSVALLAEYRQEALLEAILDAGADLIIVVPREFDGGLEHPVFGALRQRLSREEMPRIRLIHGAGDRAPSVWARDWGPLVLDNGAGSPPRLVDFSFDFGRPGDDDIVDLLGQATGHEVVHVPLSQQHGDFMSDSQGRCFVSERVARHHQELDRDEIMEFYRSAMGCTEVIFTTMYLEFQTGHLDLYAKLLSDDTMLLGEFTAATKQVMRANNLRPEFWEPFFAARLQEFEELGYRVVRVPMPFPHEKRTPSYVNSLLVGSTAIVPRFSNRAEPDAHLFAEYERAARRAYESAGYEVIFVEADNITDHGGAIHCVTMQVGAELFPPGDVRISSSSGSSGP